MQSLFALWGRSNEENQHIQVKTNMVPGGWNYDFFLNLLLTLILMLHACDEFQPIPTYGFL
jgi:hypothetical protein